MKDLRFKIYDLRSKKGFTLVEVLIAIGIIVLIAAVAIPNLRNFREDTVLSQAANEVSSGLRKAQTNAQSGVKCPSGSSGKISSSWSIFFIPTQNKFELICNYEEDDIQTSIIEQTNTLENISLTVKCNEDPPSETKISFTSISLGKSEITTPCPINTTFIVSLESKKSGQVKNINIDSNGLIFED